MADTDADCGATDSPQQQGNGQSNDPLDPIADGYSAEAASSAALPPG
ncbi:hypothetical protein [Montanilutibacter psychrotolerans]|nr:hypothetical protein [Lysobacter psychrotolerans]